MKFEAEAFQPTTVEVELTEQELKDIQEAYSSFFINSLKYNPDYNRRVSPYSESEPAKKLRAIMESRGLAFHLEDSRIAFYTEVLKRYALVPQEPKNDTNEEHK